MTLRGSPTRQPGLWLWLLLALAVSACATAPDPDDLVGLTATPRSTPTLATGVLAPPTPAVTPHAVDAPPTRPPTGPAPGRPATTQGPPTATPPPGERVALGRAALLEQDYDLAREAFSAALAATSSLTPAERAEAQFGLAEAAWGDDQAGEARSAYETFLAQTPSGPGDDRVIVAHFRLAGLAEAAGDCPGALAAYEGLLALAPVLTAYVQPRTAACHLLAGDRPASLVAYEAAVAAPAHPQHEISLRQVLAARYLEDGNLAAAVGQYDAIHALAESELTRAQVTVAAGNALIQAGDTVAGYERFRFAVDNYPRAYDSYQALIELVNAGLPVDDYQRGLVDYFAGAYYPGIEAFVRYLAEAGAGARPDARLYLAWCFEAVGDREAARRELAAYAELAPATGLLEQARLEARAGDTAAAASRYQALADQFPEDPAAPDAAWRAATLKAALDAASAVTAYRDAAGAFPEAGWAAEARFRAGWLSYQAGDEDGAIVDWTVAGGRYPAQPYGAAALLWLMRALPPDEEAHETARQAAAAVPGDGYYAFRARMVAGGEVAFAPAGALALTGDEAAERAAAEAWLAGWWGQSAGLDGLPAALSADGRWRRGRLLWQFGLYREADRELTWLRQDLAADPVASYQLALAFRDAGMYRESILAAATVRNLSGQSALELPRHLNRLLYPVYYADRIQALAAHYGYDPLLQFSLVRQESLFNSFATSVAAAQGLSQVIPDTGRYIAGKLSWPDYVNDDLYRPVVGLTFGGFYLQEQIATFDGQVHAALAAYNAGPGNAARWLRGAPDDLDLFVEIIDFPETRLYVERIYAGYEIYRRLYAARDGDG